MPTYHVYHRKEPDVTMLFGHLPEQVFPSHYQKVATVRAGDLEEVFRLTNLIAEEPWWMHSQVVPTEEHPAFRSTSVGDVVQKGRQVWMVAGMGFVEVRWALGMTLIVRRQKD